MGLHVYDVWLSARVQRIDSHGHPSRVVQGRALQLAHPAKSVRAGLVDRNRVVCLLRKKAAGCEDRTHDLRIMRPTLFQLSQTRLVSTSTLTYMKVVSTGRRKVTERKMHVVRESSPFHASVQILLIQIDGIPRFHFVQCCQNLSR